jgi:tetratricopeptide (TPR) repeat protein
MKKSAYALDDLLETCTLRVWSQQRRKIGTGFFIAPGRVVTCAHVLSERTASGQAVEVEWGGESHTAKLLKLFPDPCPTDNIFPDIALLEFPKIAHPVAFFDNDFDRYFLKGDQLSSWGYSDLRPGGESIFGSCEGSAKYDRSPERHLIKFKETQIRPGISGAPLLNERTGAICGMIKRTRDSESDLGGLAIRGELILQYLHDVVGPLARQRENAKVWLDTRDRIDKSFYEYLSTLKQFTSSDYRVLPLPRRLGIDDVYVPLRARSLDGDVATGLFDIKDVFRNLTFSPRGRNLLFQGAPGSGKSTLLRYIAHNAYDHPTDLGLNERYLPLLVRLQSLASTSRASAEARLVEAVNDAADYQLSVPQNSDFFSEWPIRQNAKWLLLLDGFDEVPTGNRAKVIQLMQLYQSRGCDLILTTRPTESLREDYARSFNRYQIDPFNESQQQLLATKWFGTGANTFIASVRAAGSDFLGSTPLLLTMAACVYESAKGLPSRRMDLYKRFIADWWEEAESRQVRAELRNELGAELANYALEGLQDVAVTMTERSEITAVDKVVDEVASRFAQKFAKSIEVMRPQTERYLEIMGRRSGVFITRGRECEWLHRTFREYFCAKAFEWMDPESRSAIDVAKKWHDDQWRQITLFCLSIWSEQKSVSSIIRRIIGKNPPYGLVFASDAIAEGAAVEEPLQREIVQLLSREAVGNAEGTICVRLLAGISDDSIKRADETLRALLQLSALPAAEPYFSQLVKTMVSFARAWEKDMGNAALNDLATLRRRDELQAIANDKRLRDWTRFEAGRELGRCGSIEDAIRALDALISEKPIKERIATGILDELGDLGGSQELLRLARTKSLDLQLRVYVAEVLDKRAMVNELSGLAQDSLLVPEVRHRALLGLLGKTQSVGKDLIEQLFITKASGTSEAEQITATLARMENWAALVVIASHPGIDSLVAQRCVSLLEASSRIEELLDLVSQGNLPHELRWLAATAVRRKGQANEVAEALLAFYTARLEALGVDDSETLKERARLYLDMDQHAAAIKDLDKVISHDATDEFSLSLRANAQRLSGNFEASISDFDRALALDKDDSWDLIRRGISHWNLDHWTEAVADFSAVQSLSPHDTFFYKYHADSLYEMDRYEEAFAVACRAVDSDFLSTMPYVVRGNVFSVTGNWQQGLQDYSQALMLDSSYEWALRRRAVAHRCCRRFDSCLNDLNMLLQLSDKNRLARVDRCEVSIRTGDYITASQDLALFAYDGDDSGWLVYLRWLLAIAKNGGSSLDSKLLAVKKETEGDLSRDPANLYKQSNLALYEIAVGDCGKADRIYEALIADERLRFLRMVALPALDDLVAICSDRVDAVALSKKVAAKVENQLAGYKLTSGGTMPRQIDEKTPRITHPVYCSLVGIQGLDKEKSRADRLLSKHAGARKTVILWRLEGDWLYGQCNFKAKPEHEYNLKFVDQIETVIQRDVPMLAAGGVTRLIFLEQELLDKFESSRDDDFDGFMLDYDLILEDEPDIAAVV